MIEIACIGDGDYLRHSGAMLHSAFSHCEGRAVRAHVLHSRPISSSDRDHLQALAARFAGTIETHHITADDIAELPDGYFPRAVWLRVFLPELLPQVQRVLYLDSDLIVTDSLLPLWDTALGEYAIGAVTNPFYPFMPGHPQRVGIDNPRNYFNSGVLLMDLARMRGLGLSRAIRDFARANPFADFPDQDALNHIFRDAWYPLHPRWNAQSPIFELPAEQLDLDPAQAREAVRSPAVVHYIGPFKPWQYLCRHPLRFRYFEHAEQTGWGRPAIQGASLENRILRLLPLAWIDAWFRFKRRLSHLNWRLRSGLKKRLKSHDA